MSRRLLMIAVGLVTVAGTARAGDEPLVPPGAKLEKLWGEGKFTEGPATGPDGAVYFSDIGNRILKFDPKSGKTSVFRDPSGRANGLIFDRKGRLIACEGANTGGNRRVSVTLEDGTVKTLADAWMGKRFNSPNDLTIDAKGRVYFSDPRYVGDENRELDHESVYRIDPDGTVTRAVTDVKKPNGLAVSPDQKTLYVAENHPDPKEKRLLLAYPLEPDGTVGERKVLHDFDGDRGIDGMCVDREGRIYAAAGRGKTGGVHVFTPQGKKVAFIPTPETPTNCTFGGEDWKTLYVTAGKSLYRIRLNAAGFPEHTPPGEKNLRGAIERGLRRLEEGARNYVTHRDCFSCHHQAMAITALSKAKRLGFEIDEELLRDQVNFTLDFFRPKLETIRKGSGVGGANATASYALYTLEAAGHPADETTDALVQFLVRRQRGDGSWPSPSKRPPTEGSPFTNAGLALQVLKTYGKARPDSGQPDDWSEQVARAIGKGREWLLRSEPSDTEDRVFHLRALLAIGADAKLIDAAREELIELQHADGSWSQLPGMEGDAYATGTVLVALRLSGVPADHPAVRKGVSYLLRTQRDDGAWLVETRSRPIQVFFDNGDPGGKSQFISMAATGWGVLALLEVFDREAGR